MADKKGEKLVIPRKEGMKQVTFWIHEDDLAKWDVFLQEKHKGHANRSKLITTAVSLFIAQGGVIPQDLEAKKIEVAKKTEIATLEAQLKMLSGQLVGFQQQLAENAREEKRVPTTEVIGRVIDFLTLVTDGARADKISSVLQYNEGKVLDVLTLSTDFKMDGMGYWRLIKK